MSLGPTPGPTKKMSRKQNRMISLGSPVGAVVSVATPTATERQLTGGPGSQAAKRSTATTVGNGVRR